MAGEDLSFTLAWADIDPAILPPEAREPGTDVFRSAVLVFLAGQYEAVGGRARIVFNDAEHTLTVNWTAPELRSLEDRAVGALDRRDLATAVPLLKALIAKAPGNPTHLYNLGMVYSDQGRLAEAKDLLAQVLAIAPSHTNSLVALGVVHARAGDADAAVKTAHKRAITTTIFFMLSSFGMITQIGSIALICVISFCNPHNHFTLFQCR